jgi:hypothetical protein
VLFLCAVVIISRSQEVWLDEHVYIIVSKPFHLPSVVTLITNRLLKSLNPLHLDDVTHQSVAEISQSSTP